MSSNTLRFFLNGKPIEIENPDPGVLLLDYFRSPEVGLIGPKKGCGQGGCGACTVIVSRWDEQGNEFVHRSVNSCLRPLCSLDGLVVTTIEGTGSTVNRLPPARLKHMPVFSRGAVRHESRKPPVVVRAQQAASMKRSKLVNAAIAGDTAQFYDPAEHTHVNPVAPRLAENNGTQCGYCTAGFVMNMSAFILNNPTASKKEIEDAFDGNICRCTGYRSILTGMKIFASDWSEQDEAERMKCILEDPYPPLPKDAQVFIPCPDAAKVQSAPLSVDRNQVWLTPQSLGELSQMIQQYQGHSVYCLLSNTAHGIYPDEFQMAQVLINLSLVKEFYGLAAGPSSLQVGAATTYTDFITQLKTLSARCRPAATIRPWGQPSTWPNAPRAPSRAMQRVSPAIRCWCSSIFSRKAGRHFLPMYSQRCRLSMRK